MYDYYWRQEEDGQDREDNTCWCAIFLMPFVSQVDVHEKNYND